MAPLKKDRIMTEKMTNLTEFAAFAEKEPQEALRFFKSARMKELIAPEEHALRAMWRALVRPPVTRSDMEEFLVGAGLKPMVELYAEESELAFYSVKDSVEETIHLRRRGWGSFVLSVRTDAEFIELPRTRLTDESFVGSSLDLAFRIQVGKLGSGLRRGSVVIEGAGRVIRVEIAASADPEDMYPSRAQADRKRLQLVNCRLEYMLDRIDRLRYAEESLQLIEDLYCMSTEDLSLMRLYQVYLEKLRGNTEEAAAILREFKGVAFTEEERDTELSCLYLRSLTGDRTAVPETTAVRIRARFEAGAGSYLLMKLLFLTNPDVGHYPRRRKKAAEETWEAGCRSPLLYAELLRDLRQDDSLMTGLGELMVQTLLFAARRGLLTEKLALRCAYLSANEKYFSAPLLRILTTAWQEWPLDGILEAIVRLLMKGQPRDGRCFPWYEKAVERNLKVIRLYEYYVETMPESRREVLPAQVRKYFALTPGDLSWELKSAVYANVVRNKEADPETYAVYHDLAESFAYEALALGRISEHDAVLYEEFIREVRDVSSAETLEKALFTERIYCDNEHVRCVVVVHDGLNEEQVVPVTRGRAYVLRYTEDAQILFEDASGRRFINGEAYTIAPIMDREVQLGLLQKQWLYRPGMLLHAVRGLEDKPCDTADVYELWKRVAQSPEMTADLRKTARCKILSYLMHHPEIVYFHSGTSDELLCLYADADRLALIHVLLDAGLFRKCYEILLGYGTEGVSPEILVRLVRRMLLENGDRKDPELLDFAMDVYRIGKYDETMLEWLTGHFSGSLEEMLSLREKARKFFIETFELDDRILMTATREGRVRELDPDIFRSYLSHGGRNVVIRAWLEGLADVLLGTDTVLDEAAAGAIAEIYERREPMDFAMKLELLKYYAGKGGLNTREELQVDRLLSECIKRGMRFGFMQRLPSDLVRQYRLMDRIFVEFRSDPADEVLISYTLDTGLEGTAGREKTEQLPHRFRGIFSKEFLLFYGEALTYRITVRSAAGELVTEERTVRAEEAQLAGSESYPRINRMLKAAKAGDEKELKEELRSYLKARDTVRALFALEETV